MKNPWIVIGVLMAVMLSGSIWYSGQVGEQGNEGIIFAPHYKGNPEATVTLVEYSDFQCPACAAFQPVLEEIITQFGDSLKIEYKHFPLSDIHSLAESAARAAEAAGQQGAFFEFHDLLYANQKIWANSPNPTGMFIQYAEELGLNIDQFKVQSRASLIRDRVREDMQEARSLGLTGTPSFFLNGERMTFLTYEEFITQIEQAVSPESTGTTKVNFGL
jgi:protein-disulfide isomerase